MKQLLTPPTLNTEENAKPEQQTHTEEVEMRGLVAVKNKENDDYYCDPTSTLCTIILFLFFVIDVVTGHNDIHEDDFPDHVKMMHRDRDNKFELEYEVKQAIESSIKVHYHQFLSLYVVTGWVEWCIM